VSGLKRELAELAHRHQRQVDEAAAMRALIEALAAPVWVRDGGGKLAFANAAYSAAVEVKNAADAGDRNTELFDHAARSELLRVHAARETYSARVPAVVAGQRRHFQVLAVPTAGGSAGIAIDASEAEQLRLELARLIEAHR
jgi:PAS domain-containing protein